MPELRLCKTGIASFRITGCPLWHPCFSDSHLDIICNYYYFFPAERPCKRIAPIHPPSTILRVQKGTRSTLNCGLPTAMARNWF